MMRFKLALSNADHPEQLRDAAEVRRFCKLFENSWANFHSTRPVAQST
jgi:hypothetical protein